MNFYDVVIVGGGHNGLVAATYLAQAGLSTLVLEQQPHTGGAAVSQQVFRGVDARLSRYSYLVSLLPDKIVSDLGLSLELRSRGVASYTPVRRSGRDLGLMVDRPEGSATRESFARLTGSDKEYDAWTEFYGAVGELAAVIAPTLLEPLQSADSLRSRVDPALWDELVERPFGESVERRFSDDTVRGVVATDAVIGTFAGLHDESLIQNRCFLYHLIGNGTGEWRVPVGGMGAVTDALAAAARRAGAVLITNAAVTAVEVDGVRGSVTWLGGDGERSVDCKYVLSNVAPATLDALRGRDVAAKPEGSQLKVNLLLSRLPALRSGDDPTRAFAGTFHIDEDYSQLESAYRTAAAGALPDVPPSEVYCHSLTDPSILSPELIASGHHTLTVFGVHFPARLFAADNDSARAEATRRVLAGLDSYLAEPLADCIARDADGNLCIESKTPQDIENSIGMPGGHIFHGDLQWPWSPTPTAPNLWGTETDTPNLLLCGSGARRGGAVSGLGGHNAAMSILTR
ncbi:NAD(P)/FAD-dependent oxidoreductase [Kribbella sandramycini]|uniref:Pyridine nucleotide-disulfide oxidoreductase domain-containing protein 2 n=1 Tax=Kribbella sandramycini TaxID=60450 RepID=A0A7Y4NY94_9ACTN|nr:NAD(P)/FAD-dependent oxidoreductase [Kribbella sandramycini]MBB6567801.1 phytoene dehydrogenase-like protein [Kribbella sandramycini]NOL39603.1 NAD(P)/FAD-dependent oxidoreductase [Kribbella sandramycini]